jgi:hypothetical protein
MDTEVIGVPWDDRLTMRHSCEGSSPFPFTRWSSVTPLLLVVLLRPGFRASVAVRSLKRVTTVVDARDGAHDGCWLLGSARFLHASPVVTADA